jgi:hypothetical protein
MGTGAYGLDLPADWNAQSLYDLQKYTNYFCDYFHTRIKNDKARRNHGGSKMLRCKSVLQALIVTSVDYCRLARLRACIYCRLLAR